MINKYLNVIKPKIILGNGISIIGGFFLASQGTINYPMLIITLIGFSLVMASGLVCNNYIDYDMDHKMKRTKNRVLVNGLINKKNTILYAITLGISGFTLLYCMTNNITIYLSIIGFIIYVCIYSMYMKRHSIYSTFTASLSGSVPSLIGYCVVKNNFNFRACILLIIFILWQIPHSYAIAIYCFNDYKKAKIPLLPVVKGMDIAKKHINLYILAFILFTIIFFFIGYTNYKYMILYTTTNICWLILAIYGDKNNIIFARKVFLFSIFTIILLNIMISLPI